MELTKINSWEDVKIGANFKFMRKRSIFTVIAIFEDNGEKYFVAKCKNGYDIDSYANIFTFRNGELKQHV